MSKKEAVNHPDHYGDKDDPYEVIKIIQNFPQLTFATGNTIKYVLRAGKKDPNKLIEDLEKAKQYLDFEINYLKKRKNESNT